MSLNEEKRGKRRTRSLPRDDTPLIETEETFQKRQKWLDRHRDKAIRYSLRKKDYYDPDAS